MQNEKCAERVMTFLSVSAHLLLASARVNAVSSIVVRNKKILPARWAGSGSSGFIVKTRHKHGDVGDSVTCGSGLSVRVTLQRHPASSSVTLSVTHQAVISK